MAKLGLPFHRKHGGDGANNGVDTSTRRRDPAPRGGMKSHLLAFVPEFVGTVLFLWFAFAIHQMAIDRTGVLAQDGPGSLSAQTVVIIALGYGFSYLVMVWALYRVTDGFFNPAVTVSLCLAGALSPIRGAILFIAQLLGGMAAAGLVECMFPGSITVVNTYLSPDTSIVRGLFIEMFLTTMLVTTVLMLATDRHTRRDTSGLSAGGRDGRDGRDGFVSGPGYRHDAINAPRRDNVTAPIGMGLALFVANMAGVYYTGASLNPARSFGPSVAGTDFPGYHWIYWLGPLLGSLLAAAYYRFVRMFHEEEGYAAPDYGAAGHGHGVAGGHATHDVESGHAGYDGVSVPVAGHTSTTTAPGHMAHPTTANTAARV